MKIVLHIFIIILINFKVVNADTKQAETGSVGATVSKNLTEEHIV